MPWPDADETRWVKGVLYPDCEAPAAIEDLDDRVDFLARLCGAWDFGHLPDSATVVEIRRADWRDAVEACRLLTSPTYHLLRVWHRLPALPYLGGRLPHIADDPNLAYI